MSWLAVVPLKRADERKTRLAGILSPAERTDLSERLARRVIDCLSAHPDVPQVFALSPDPVAGAQWVQDRGRGLNAELAAFRETWIAANVLVIHADLPLLGPDDISALIAAAKGGRIALAPDRHGQGTNAAALPAGSRLAFRFGPGSFAAHIGQAAGHAVPVHRPGLALDIDDPADLALAQARKAGAGDEWR